MGIKAKNSVNDAPSSLRSLSEDKQAKQQASSRNEDGSSRLGAPAALTRLPLEFQAHIVIVTYLVASYQPSFRFVSPSSSTVPTKINDNVLIKTSSYPVLYS